VEEDTVEAVQEEEEDVAEEEEEEEEEEEAVVRQVMAVDGKPSFKQINCLLAYCKKRIQTESH
jgi:hypothetical protein